MKINYLILAFALATMTLASCSDEEDKILGVQDEQNVSQDRIFTYDMYFDSEITSYDGNTRATTASDWEDGDVVYIHFYGNNDAYGQAQYISSSKKWRVTCDKAFVDATNNSCAVWFGKGVNPSETSTGILYEYMTEAYNTNVGSYSYSNNSIYVNANMKPNYWRLRFKGNVGTQIGISGPKSVYRVHFYGTSQFSYHIYVVNLTVKSDGYTDYFVGYTGGDVSTITLNNYTTGISYSRDFNSNTLSAGESGYYTIPTSSDLHGWTKK